MSFDARSDGGPWHIAAHVLALHAIDPIGTGGVVLRGRPGPARDAWLACHAASMPSGTRVLRVPPDVAIGRLVGGLDLAATLAAGRSIAERGLLATADGGAIVLPLAERLRPEVAGAIVQALDTHGVRLERDGLSELRRARFGVVALDEGEDDERPPAALLDRLAFDVDLSGMRLADFEPKVLPDPEAIAAARGRLAAVEAGEAVMRVLCEASIALGVVSLGALQRALHAARADAALRGGSEVDEAALGVAIALVLLPRATRFPSADALDDGAREATPPDAARSDERPPDDFGAEDAPASPPPPADARSAGSDASPPPADASDREDRAPREAEATTERVLSAVRASVPPDLLARLEAAATSGAIRRGGSAGRGAAHVAGAQRGRPVGSRRARPDGRHRIALIDTLRTAAPWQPIRRRAASEGASGAGSATAVDASVGPVDAERAGRAKIRRLHVRPDDFHVVRTRQRVRTTTIFAVDASGSTAMSRLAEAKGAVERLLAQSYVRRDAVALVAFRGPRAQILLPPTRSLVRAKRELGALPAGGGTPLASGLLAVLAVAEQVRRGGGRPIAVVLSDGQANVAADGSLGRSLAFESALEAARRLRSARIASLFVDTSARPRDATRALAEAMGAAWMMLPRSAAEGLARAALDLAQGSEARGSEASGSLRGGAGGAGGGRRS